MVNDGDPDLRNAVRHFGPFLLKFSGPKTSNFGGGGEKKMGRGMGGKEGKGAGKGGNRGTNATSNFFRPPG